MSEKVIFHNKKAIFGHNLDKKFEAGIVLDGLSVKNIRNNDFNAENAFVSIEKGELFIRGISMSNIPPKAYKLLLHKEEIGKIFSELKDKSMKGFLLNIKISDKGLIKIDIGIGKIKKVLTKLAEKKRATKKRDLEREYKELKV